MHRFIGVLPILLFAGLIASAEPTGKNGATVAKWADGLAAPHGLASAPGGDVVVVENGTGRLLRFGRTGERRGVLADGLRGPSFALALGGKIYVGERQGNAVAQIGGDGSVTRLGGEVTDPLGLAAQNGSLLVVSHRQSVVRRWAATKGGFTPVEAPVLAPTGGAKYGWRDLAVTRDGTLLVTDEVSGAVLRRRPGGTLEAWAKNLSSPSGLAIGPKGDIYVTEEGGGRVSRIQPTGEVVSVAEGLGAARDALFLDERTLLVSDRAGGVVWKVVLPR